jgi:hypothetical protein
MGTSFLAVLLAVFVVFLGILGGLSVAVTKTVNPDGRVSRGFFGALGSVLTLVFLCGMGLFGTGIFVAAIAIGTAVDKNPIQRIEVRRDAPLAAAAAEEGSLEHADTILGDVIRAGRRIEDARDPEGPVHLFFSVEGGHGDALLGFLEDVVGFHRDDLREVLTVREHVAEDGTTLDLYEFELPLTNRDLGELEDELRRELDGLRVRLPDSVAIEFAGAKRLY